MRHIIRMLTSASIALIMCTVFGLHGDDFVTWTRIFGLAIFASCYINDLMDYLWGDDE